MGVKTAQLVEGKGRLAGARIVRDGYQVMLISDGGTVIRMAVDGIKRSGRATQGVIVMRLARGREGLEPRTGDRRRGRGRRRRRSRGATGRRRGDRRRARDRRVTTCRWAAQSRNLRKRDCRRREPPYDPRHRLAVRGRELSCREGRTISRGCNTVVVGAGPYGLSIAAHLRVKGLDHRIFGNPLETWRTAMPAGHAPQVRRIRLESLRAAPRLDPRGLLSIARDPVPPDARSGRRWRRSSTTGSTSSSGSFRTWSRGTVASVVRLPKGFRVTLDDGEELDARQVVVAAGITHFASLPAAFEGLPASLVTHANAHRELDRFGGQDVTVLGAGASAVELAVGLAAIGARARLVARSPVVKFSSAPNGHRNLVDQAAPAVVRIWVPEFARGCAATSRISSATSLVAPAGRSSAATSAPPRRGT